MNPFFWYVLACHFHILPPMKVFTGDSAEKTPKGDNVKMTLWLFSFNSARQPSSYVHARTSARTITFTRTYSRTALCIRPCFFIRALCTPFGLTCPLKLSLAPPLMYALYLPAPYSRLHLSLLRALQHPSVFAQSSIPVSPVRNLSCPRPLFVSLI